LADIIIGHFDTLDTPIDACGCGETSSTLYGIGIEVRIVSDATISTDVLPIVVCEIVLVICLNAEWVSFLECLVMLVSKH